MNEREAARLRLQESVDHLGKEASLHTQMQREPLKMLGIATGVGAVLGLVLGRSTTKTRKIYVDETLSKKDQKAFAQSQARHYKSGGTNVGGALLATAGTLAFKVLQDRVIAPKLAELAGNLVDQASERGGAKAGSSGKAGGYTYRSAPRPSLEVQVRDFRAPAEKAHADERGNIHLTPAQQEAGTIAAASRDVQVRDFRAPAEKAHATQYGSILSDAPKIGASQPSGAALTKTDLEKH